MPSLVTDLCVHFSRAMFLRQGGSGDVRRDAMNDVPGEYDECDMPPRPRYNGRSGAGTYGGRQGAEGLPGQAPSHSDLPLRILVNSEMVGAIIGRQGSTIRQITQSTRAR